MRFRRLLCWLLIYQIFCVLELYLFGLAEMFEFSIGTPHFSRRLRIWLF